VGLRPKIVLTGVFAPPTTRYFSLRGQRKVPLRKAARMPRRLRRSPALRSPNRGSTTGPPAPTWTARHPWRAPCRPYPIRTPVLGAAYGVEEPVRYRGARNAPSGTSSFSSCFLFWREAPLERAQRAVFETPMARRATQPKAETARRGRARDGASSAFGAGGPVCRPRLRRVAQGTAPKGRRAIGAAFLLVPFLWPLKEKEPGAGGRNPPSK